MPISLSIAPTCNGSCHSNVVIFSHFISSLISLFSSSSCKSSPATTTSSSFESTTPNAQNNNSSSTVSSSSSTSSSSGSPTDDSGCGGSDDVIGSGVERRRRKKERNGNKNFRAVLEEEVEFFEKENGQDEQTLLHLRQTSQISTDTSFSNSSGSSNGEQVIKPRFRTPADQLVSELFETIKAKNSSSPKSLQHPAAVRAMDEVFTMTSFGHHDLNQGAASLEGASISSLRKIWESDENKSLRLTSKKPWPPTSEVAAPPVQRPVVPVKPNMKKKESAAKKSNIYAAPSELYAAGKGGSKEPIGPEIVYADVDGVLDRAKDLVDTLRVDEKHDKTSLMSLADRVESFRHVCTHYADNVCATGRFRFRAQLNRLGQMGKELVFLASRSPQHGPKPIIQEIELITRDLIVLIEK